MIDETFHATSCFTASHRMEVKQARQGLKQECLAATQISQADYITEVDDNLLTGRPSEEGASDRKKTDSTDLILL